MQSGIFLEVSLILVVATVVSAIVTLLRQPIIIGYILTGLLVGPAVFNLVHSTETLELFSRIGVALLLFIIGLGLNPRVIKEVGKVSLITGIGQIFFTAVIGFVITRLLGFDSIASLYISVAIAFSSTIIILKLLSDKKELNKLYGKVATGFLLVQDMVAVLILIVVTSLSNGQSGLGFIGGTLLKGFAFVGALSLLSVFILPRLSNFFAKSQEMLLLFSIGWGLGVAAVCVLLGFSIEIGALAAGVALAASPYSFEISSRMRPLRDFFIILFFIMLGATMSLGNIGVSIVPALVLSAFILIGNPLIVMILMGMLGYSRKTSFKSGLVVAQISEFSLLLVLLGNRVGHLPEKALTMMTMVGLITIAGCTYLMLNSDKLFSLLEPYLGIFERKKRRSEKTLVQSYEVILFGYIAGSKQFVKTFKKLGKKYLVVDYDPETIDNMESQNIPCRYGDASDVEFLEELPLENVRLVVVNVTDFGVNKLITSQVRYRNKNAVIIAMNKSDRLENSLELYDDGASYVVMPHHQATDRISHIIRQRGISNKNFASLKDTHTKKLLKEHTR